MKEIDVLVAGGGPVGMTLAYALATLGVKSLLVERNATTSAHPKMDITNSRSMELFAKIGLADRLRAIAVADSQPFDVSWITTLNGHELHRFTYPGVADIWERIREHNDGSQVSQPPMRVSQVLVEPVLKEAIENHPLVDVRFSTELAAFSDGPDGLIVTVRANDGTVESLRASWLVGCDGGRSMVREQLGIMLHGKSNVSRRFITHFRSNAVHLLQRWGAAWHYQSNRGTLVAQNDKDIWTLLSRLPEGAKAEEIDPSKLIEEFVGEPIDHDVIVTNSWSPQLLVADSYAEGRVFIAGDAAHQYIPTGGYGMNTGIGDAFDLAWKLAATVRGFGGPLLPHSYERERRPVALDNCAASARHNEVRLANAALYTGDLFAETPKGEKARAEAGARIAILGNAENESFGIEHGYCYNASPIVIPDPTEAPSRDPLDYTPTTLPGARLPSVFLSNGSNLYDHLSLWFTLLVDGDVDTRPLVQAASDLGVPMEVCAVELSEHKPLFCAAAYIVRPDLQIAWRGNPPADPDTARSIVARIAGWPPTH